MRDCGPRFARAIWTMANGVEAAPSPCCGWDWDGVHAALLAQADANGEIKWTVPADSTIKRAHRHGTNLLRITGETAGVVWPYRDTPDVELTRQELQRAYLRVGVSELSMHINGGRGLPGHTNGWIRRLLEPGPRSLLSPALIRCRVSKDSVQHGST